MTKHIINGFITYEKSKYASTPTVDFRTYRPSKKNWPDMVVVAEHSIEVEVPDNFDPRQELIAALKEQMTQERADFEMRITEIKRQISEYEAIGMDEVKS